MMRATARHAAAPARCSRSQGRALDVWRAVEQWIEGLQHAAQAAAQHAAEDQQGPEALRDGLGLVAFERCGTPGTWWVLNSGAGLALCDYCAGPEGLNVGQEAAQVAAYETQWGGPGELGDGAGAAGRGSAVMAWTLDAMKAANAHGGGHLWALGTVRFLRSRTSAQVHYN